MEYPKAHPWTLKKLGFLKKYLPAFVKATQKALSRHYVDGFAGPGYNQQTDGSLVEGSPLLAIQHPQFTSFFFVEENRSSYTELERNLRERDPGLRGIHLYRGDFNFLVDNILQQIHPRAPTLFFLDPFGLELRWTTVEKIAGREKADIFILISSSGANRARKNHPHTLDEFFGDASWQNVRQKPGQSWFEAFTEAYRDRMRGLGLNGTGLVTVARNSNNAPMHVLAFHSKNKIALQIANAVFSRIETDPVQPGLRFGE
ncbi:three-Cys-motif partner protein TcmP [Meiothermus sp. CFH 77666]|uniref:three-Cys-motif partner protein TcmP n=1 Tax=Meiothermus sp. CFH 77666 TaxID=2817942 RepID=UPI001AA03471|nr:three-Cys-motif partner protein TcmP [Meiothermus sp. CFH 77666]MBO1438628.1 three-Cys-motif partner protein TcmP [Meiothermus sp. CFH 77666]